MRVYKPLNMWGDVGFNPELMTEIIALKSSADFVTDTSGSAGTWMRNKTGATFKVSAIVKLLLLGTLKFSSMDPYGMGVEMEGGKPGWNDAMNGLPGILGSGMPETYEMLQIIRFVNKAVKTHQRPVDMPVEFVSFLQGMDAALQVFASSANKTEADEFIYWDASNNAREQYRSLTRVRFDGATQPLSASYLTTFLTAMGNKVTRGIARALQTNGGFSPTYFSNEVVDYELKQPVTVTFPPTAGVVVPKSFIQHSLPHYFLEGPTRQLKTITSVEEKRHV